MKQERCSTYMVLLDASWLNDPDIYICEVVYFTEVGYAYELVLLIIILSFRSLIP